MIATNNETVFKKVFGLRLDGNSIPAQKKILDMVHYLPIDPLDLKRTSRRLNHSMRITQTSVRWMLKSLPQRNEARKCTNNVTMAHLLTVEGRFK